MRPLSVGELLDAAFAAVRRNFGTLVLCTLVVVVPVAVVNTLITASTSDQAFDFGATNTITEDEVGPYIAGTLATALLSLIAQTLTAAACLRALGGAMAIALLGVIKVALVDPLRSDFALIAAPQTINFGLLVVVLLGASVLVSALGSGLSLRRFLRV